jgi:hypothetical protein
MSLPTKALLDLVLLNLNDITVRLSANQSEAEDARDLSDAIDTALSELRVTAKMIADRDAKESTAEMVDPHTLLMSIGGKWLGTARHWIQCNAYNGDSVTWGSSDELRRGSLTVAEVERFAAEVAAAAINEDRKQR